MDRSFPQKERGPQYNEQAIAVGAQTERRGLGRAGEGLAWRLDLTGRFLQLAILFAARYSGRTVCQTVLLFL
jgi:hypothetical protein